MQASSNITRRKGRRPNPRPVGSLRFVSVLIRRVDVADHCTYMYVINTLVQGIIPIRRSSSASCHPERWSPRTRVQGRTERLDEIDVCGVGMRRFPSPPNPLSHKEFKGGQNMWTNAMFEALGCACWPSPPAPLPKWERDDSGARVWHPIAVHSYYEHLFCPPLNGRGGGYDKDPTTSLPEY
jgi:hypothetical protein